MSFFTKALCFLGKRRIKNLSDLILSILVNKATRFQRLSLRRLRNHLRRSYWGESQSIDFQHVTSLTIGVWQNEFKIPASAEEFSHNIQDRVVK